MRDRTLTSLALVALTIAACGNTDGAADEPDPTTAATDGGIAVDEPPAAADGRMGVIVDYSPTTSDVTALLYVSRHPAAELLAVTLAGTGESHCDRAVANTRALLALVDRPDVPVACGPEQPVGPGNEWPADWRDAADRLDGLDLAAVASTAANTDIDAIDLLASTAADHDPVTIVALGPLTNLAAAVATRPDLAEHVAGIVTMGGAVDVDGNATNGAAEWNYFIDPTAVDVVLGSGIPVTMVPLDATNSVPVTRAWFDALVGHRTTAAADAVHDLFAASRPYDIGFYFWDELAAAAALDPTVVTFDERPIVIDLDGPEQGRTRIDPTGPTVKVAVAADRQRFERELLTTLNGGVAPPARPDAAADEIEYFSTVEVIVAEMSASIETLFENPLALEMEAIEQRAEQGTLTPADEETVRTFVTEFWTEAEGHLRTFRDALAELDPSASIRTEHDAYVDALDALIASTDDRLAEVATAGANELLVSLWGPNAEIEAVEAACSALGGAASRLGIDASTCPG